MEKSNSAWGSQMKFEVNLFSFLEVSLKEYILGTRIGKKANNKYTITFLMLISHITMVHLWKLRNKPW